MPADMFDEVNAAIEEWWKTQTTDAKDSQGISRAMLIARGEGYAFRRALDIAQRNNLCLWPLVGPRKCPFNSEGA